MREYTTQMDAARKGIITPELTKVAEKEHMREDELLPLVAEGKVVIPAKITHLSESRRNRVHASDEDQRQSRHLQRLQGLRY